MSGPFVIEVGLASSTHYLPWLRKFIGATGVAAGRPFTPTAVWRCSVALVEAVNNAIIHAHHRDPHRRVWIHCRIDRHGVIFTVRDEGKPFTPQWDRLPASCRSQGRGLYLMRTLMSRVRYRRRKNGNEIELTYKDDCKGDGCAI